MAFTPFLSRISGAQAEHVFFEARFAISTTRDSSERFLSHSVHINERVKLCWAILFHFQQGEYFHLTRRFRTGPYALVPAGAKLSHFGLWEEITRD